MHVAFRIDAKTRARLEAIRQEFSTPWRKATFSDILRLVTRVGLEVVEKQRAEGVKKILEARHSDPHR
jgi:hypothetical protein